MLQIINHENGVVIKGDDAVLAKAQKGNGNIPVELTSIEGLRVDADELVELYDKAERTGPIYDGDELAGYPYTKQYAAMRAKYIEQQELAKIERDKPEEQHEPAMTSESIKPEDAQ